MCNRNFGRILSKTQRAKQRFPKSSQVREQPKPMDSHFRLGKQGGNTREPPGSQQTELPPVSDEEVLLGWV